MEGLLTGLIWLLVYALIICVVVYVIARLATQFMPGAAAYVWLLWAIGGILLLIMALRLFAPVLGHP